MQTNLHGIQEQNYAVIDEEGNVSEKTEYECTTCGKTYSEQVKKCPDCESGRWARGGLHDFEYIPKFD